MSAPHTQILVPNTIFHCKEPGLLGKTAESRAGAGSVHDAVPKSESAGGATGSWQGVSGHRSQRKGLPVAKAGAVEGK